MALYFRDHVLFVFGGLIIFLGENNIFFGYLIFLFFISRVLAFFSEAFFVGDCYFYFFLLKTFFSVDLIFYETYSEITDRQTFFLCFLSYKKSTFWIFALYEICLSKFCLMKFRLLCWIIISVVFLCTPHLAYVEAFTYVILTIHEYLHKDKNVFFW